MFGLRHWDDSLLGIGQENNVLVRLELPNGVLEYVYVIVRDTYKFKNSIHNYKFCYSSLKYKIPLSKVGPKTPKYEFAFSLHCTFFYLTFYLPEKKLRETF